MNLRDVENYSIGLDIGTGSVGWAVVDEDGELCKFKGKNTWGSRLFDSAKTAAETRSFRTLRRRYGRRYRRIQNLREFLLPDIAKVDPEFFCRLNQSDLIKNDRDFSEDHVLFNGDPFTESGYYEQYPTIYHLRNHLVHSSGQEDIRLVYLALHHMMKYRGNFLMEGDLSASSADSKGAVDMLLSELEEYCNGAGLEWNRDYADAEVLGRAVSSAEGSRRERQERFSSALGLPSAEKARAKQFGHAVFGYETEFSALFPVEKSSETKFSLDNEDKKEEFVDKLLPDECTMLFDVLVAVHNAYLLAGILEDAQEGDTLSACMVRRYESHKEDLKNLKALVRKYYPVDENGSNKKYNELFRGSRYAKDGVYKKTSAKGYAGYILGKVRRDDFYKLLKSLFNGFKLSVDDRDYWDACKAKMDEDNYLPKLRRSENGAIPHQLHLEEMKAIIEHQKQFYPTLAEHGDRIMELLSFRLPYYVGPLGKESNPARKKPFSWAVRKPGKESEPVRPWNFEEVIDVDACAEAFITNLTGECTYWLGKKVIPKNSLLYSEFCVLQELNVCKNNLDGEKSVRLTQEDAHGIFENVFKKKKKVRVSDVEEYLKSVHPSHYHITGTQRNEDGEFASSLASYIDFKNILGREIESYEDREMVETLILWATVFEDKKIFARKVAQTYGPDGNGALTADQVKRVCKKRYTGWSNLSREFLEELRADYDGGRVSVMDMLRDSGGTRPMNLMEILADKRFGFREKLDELNQDFLSDQQGSFLDDIPGSPAIKRGINQSMKIVKEIVSIAGKPPARICVEMAREDVGKGKGKQTSSRLKQIEGLYSSLKKDLALYGGQTDLRGELKKYEDRLEDERVFLYFLQCGKCAYSGRPLDIDNLQLYHVDHIIPQSMVKDDSLSNKVLVLQSENERKLDQYPLPAEMRSGSSYARWAAWRDVGLMSKKKYNALTASFMSDRQAKGFINRQLVETRQISKHVVSLLQAEYPDTKVESVKADLSHNLRVHYGFYKDRDVNDWHHAHDAYLACQLSRFVSVRFPRISEDFDYAAFTRYSKVIEKAQHSHSGLIVNSFQFNGFDPETGEVFRDSWYGEAEVARIRRCLNYKDCFVSRKTERLTGAFWNQTVYSPREKSPNAIPLKKGKSTENYGYYMTPAYSYYSVIEYAGIARGKKKRVVSMIGIPVNEANGIKNESDLLAYLELKYENPRILKAFVPKYQKIEWKGTCYYITSPTEMMNARQLWLPRKYMESLSDLGSEKAIREKGEVLSERADELYEYLCLQVNTWYPRYKNVYAKLVSEKSMQTYREQSLEEKTKVLRGLLGILHCDARRGLLELNLSSGLGRLDGISFGNSISEIAFIDSSVTGMFEKRSRIEL